jgi:hypothetical protein
MKRAWPDFILVLALPYGLGLLVVVDRKYGNRRHGGKKLQETGKEESRKGKLSNPPKHLSKQNSAKERAEIARDG